MSNLATYNRIFVETFEVDEAILAGYKYGDTPSPGLRRPYDDDCLSGRRFRHHDGYR